MTSRRASSTRRTSRRAVSPRACSRSACRCIVKAAWAPLEEWCRFDREAFQDTLEALAEDKAKREVGEEVDEALDKHLDSETARKIDETLGEGASKELGDKLRGLFK